MTKKKAKSEALQAKSPFQALGDDVKNLIFDFAGTYHLQDLRLIKKYCDLVDPLLQVSLTINPTQLAKLLELVNKGGLSNFSKSLYLTLEGFETLPTSELQSFFESGFLKKVVITECDKALELAQYLQKNSNLRNLTIDGNSNGQDYCIECGGILYFNRKLQKLIAPFSGIGPSGISFISEVLRSKTSSLEYLDISGNNIRLTGVSQIVESLKVNKKLRSLYLGTNYITDTGAVYLSSALEVNTTLTELDLSYNEITSVGAAAIGEALKLNKALKTLSLATNEIGATGLQSLANALKTNTTLSSLNIYNNTIWVDEIDSIAQALTMNKSLTSFNIGGNEIKDSGAETLFQALFSNFTLRELKMNDTGITKLGAAMLSKYLKSNNSLETLVIGLNHITSRGTKHIADALIVNRTLRCLHMPDNNIGDKGTFYLADAFRQNGSLEELYLSGNNISTIGSRYLMTGILRSNTSLKQLDLSRNRLIKDSGSNYNPIRDMEISFTV